MTAVTFMFSSIVVIVTVLSILVPTVKSRRSLLSRLLWTLDPQNLNPEVEVIVHPSMHLGMGDKLNELYAAAKGRYACVVDDDDLVPPNFTASLLRAMEDRSVDFVGFRVLYTENGSYVAEYPHDPTRGTNSAGAVIRSLSKACAIEVEMARAHPFGNETSSDFQWVDALLASGYPRNPVYLNEVLYHYDCWPQHSLHPSDGYVPTQRWVGEWPHRKGHFRWLI